MRRLRLAAERGLARFPGLDSRHTFSFGHYFDPRNEQLSALRVINDDRVAPSVGFPTHGHRDMEIFTWVTAGTLMHRDSLGNEGTVQAGEMQAMSAGTGIEHSEFNGSTTEPLRFLQIWIMPDASGHTPRWQQVDTHAIARPSGLTRLVGPEGSDAPMTIHQDAAIDLVRPVEAEPLALALAPERIGYLHVSRGAMRLDGHRLVDGDGVAFTDGARLEADPEHPDSEALLFDLPPGRVALTGVDLEAVPDGDAVADAVADAHADASGMRTGTP